MEIEVDVPVVMSADDHPTVEIVGDEMLLRPQGRDDLVLSFTPGDLSRWVKEVKRL